MTAARWSTSWLLGSLLAGALLAPPSAQAQSVSAGVGLRGAGHGALSGSLSGRMALRGLGGPLFLDASVTLEQGPDALKAGNTRELNPDGRYIYIRNGDGRVNPKDARLSRPTVLEVAARAGVEGAPWFRKRVWTAAGVGRVSGAMNDPESGANGWQIVAGVGIELAGWTELAFDWRSGASGMRFSLQMRYGW
jgi:hypothetical protein